MNNGEKVVVGAKSNLSNKELVKTIVKSYLWNEMLETGEVSSVKDIMKLESIKSDRYIYTILRLKFLNPKIIDSIISQGNPHAYTYKQLIKMNSQIWVL